MLIKCERKRESEKQNCDLGCDCLWFENNSKDYCQILKQVGLLIYGPYFNPYIIDTKHTTPLIFGFDQKLLC